MFRRKRFGRNSQSEESSGHHDRPWVYFMVDCFFLVTQFYVATFHVKGTESVLPQKLPPGNIGKPGPRSSDEPIYIHVSNENGQVGYKLKDSTLGPAALSDRLVNVKQAFSNDVVVRVSYDADVPWENVMTVFNSCNKAGIAKCGLIPLRGDKAGR